MKEHVTIVTAGYNAVINLDVNAEPGQKFTLTEQDTTITTNRVNIKFSCFPYTTEQVATGSGFFDAFGTDVATGPVFDEEGAEGLVKVADNSLRMLPDDVKKAIQNVVLDALTGIQ